VARAAFCLGTIKAGTFKIVSAMLDVAANFLLDLGVDFRTPEEGGDAGMKQIEDFHFPSGC
jgi:hypothetical protein